MLITVPVAFRLSMVEMQSIPSVGFFFPENHERVENPSNSFNRAYLEFLRNWDVLRGTQHPFHKAAALVIGSSFSSSSSQLLVASYLWIPSIFLFPSFLLLLMFFFFFSSIIVNLSVLNSNLTRVARWNIGHSVKFDSNKHPLHFCINMAHAIFVTYLR